MGHPVALLAVRREGEEREDGLSGAVHTTSSSLPRTLPPAPISSTFVHPHTPHPPLPPLPPTPVLLGTREAIASHCLLRHPIIRTHTRGQ